VIAGAQDPACAERAAAWEALDAQATQARRTGENKRGKLAKLRGIVGELQDAFASQRSALAELNGRADELRKTIAAAEAARDVAEKAERDITRDKEQWKRRALAAEAALRSMGAEVLGDDA
jgi:chromosome segregation ATPase